MPLIESFVHPRAEMTPDWAYTKVMLDLSVSMVLLITILYYFSEVYVEDKIIVY